MGDWNAFAGNLINPAGYAAQVQATQRQKMNELALAQAGMQTEDMKQKFADQQTLRNALTSAASENEAPLTGTETPLPLPQVTEGPGGTTSLNMPSTGAQPLQKNLDKVVYDHLKKTNPEAAQHFEGEILKKAELVEKMGGLDEANQILKDSLGWNVNISPQMDHITYTDEDGSHIATINKRTGEVMKTTQLGKPKGEEFTLKEGEVRFKKQADGSFLKIAQGGEKETKSDDAQAYALDKIAEWEAANPGKKAAAGMKAKFLAEYKKLAKPASETAGLAREDRSWTDLSKRLEKQQEPLAKKIAESESLLAQLKAGTAITDSDIAPKWLTFTAGGQGTGLRMSDSEIGRVENGGLTVWENLERLANRWSLEPQHARIPEEARQTMIKFAEAGVKSLRARLNVLEDAGTKLTGEHDIKKMRTMYDEAVKASRADKVEGLLSGKILMKYKPTGEIRSFKKGDPKLAELQKNSNFEQLGEE